MEVCCKSRVEEGLEARNGPVLRVFREALSTVSKLGLSLL